jgi:efflux ABC transporter, permease protein
VLKTNNDFLGVTLKGVDRDFDSTFIHECMAQGQIPKFGTEASTQQLLISKHIADKLKLTTGNRIFAYFLDGQHLRIRRFTIAGVYATNMKQFDEQMCFADITTVNKINGWKPDQYTGAEITVESTHALDMTAKNVLKKVKNRTDKYGETYSSATIFEQYPQIFSWLGLMDLNVWIILALMLAVAGVTMISGLLIIILERTQTIGLLKALGARNAQVRHIFLWFSVFIIGKGLVIGNLLGLGICLLQKYTGLVKLDPQTYYVSTVPVDVDWLIVVILNISTLLICIFVLIGPSYLVSRIHPARSMHYE